MEEIHILKPTTAAKPAVAGKHIRGIYVALHKKADAAKERRDMLNAAGKNKADGRMPCACGSGKKFKNCCRGI